MSHTTPRTHVALGLLLTLALGAAAAAQEAVPRSPKPLSEANLLDLLDLAIPAPVIAARVKASGISFRGDEATLKKLADAGAPAEVIAAIREAEKKRAAAPAAAERLMLWVTTGALDKNHLKSEVSINGKKIGDFKVATQQYLDGELKVGWNEISVKTAPEQPTVACRGLWFTLGGVRDDKATGKPEMNEPLWSFHNANGWHFQDRRWIHDFGPRMQEVTLTFRVYYAGLGLEAAPIKDDDYLLDYDSHALDNDALTSTIFINGQPLNSFFNHERAVVITPLLKQGWNEIRLTSSPVKNGTYGGIHPQFQILGPMEYSADKRWSGPERLEFLAGTGWQRNERTQRLVYQEDTSAASSDDVYHLFLGPQPSPEDAARGRLVMRVETGALDANHMASDVSINGEEIGRFTAATEHLIEGHLKPGWNDITFKTMPLKPHVQCRGLWFTIGWVREDATTGKQVFGPKLWSFHNALGWDYEEGKYVHDLGTKTKEAVLSFKVFLAGEKLEMAKPAEGDYVLQSDSNSLHHDAVTATVYVNGMPLNSFVNEERAIVLTPLLKPGKNEIRVVTTRVGNNTYGDHQDFSIVGPLKRSAAQKTLVGDKPLEFRSMTGWKRVEETQRLIYKDDPAVERSEDVFVLDGVTLP